MPWYFYHRGGWHIAVDAVSHQDAAKLIHQNAPGATYDGEAATPPGWGMTTATGMITPAREREIAAHYTKIDGIERIR